MILREEDKPEIGKRLETMVDPVRFVFFTQLLAGACEYCRETEQLLKELTGLHEKLSLDVKNFVTDTADVQKYGIDKIPATAVVGKSVLRVRFYGIPSGYEFVTLLETVLKASTGESGLTPVSKQKIQTVKKPVHLQVFVTPTCPYCPGAALAGVQFAMENPFISTDIIEITEFPHLAHKFGVMGVPKTIINQTRSIEGAVPEGIFLEHIMEAVKDSM